MARGNPFLIESFRIFSLRIFSCGLVGARMACEYLQGSSTESSVGSFLPTAKELGYSEHGEMFDAEQLADLGDSIDLNYQFIRLQSIACMDTEVSWQRLLMSLTKNK